MDVDLTHLPDGATYESRYQGYLEIFKQIAETDIFEPIYVTAAPYSWMPLLLHLRCTIMSAVEVFDHCALVKNAVSNVNYKLDRTAIEVLCCFRPETADGLWKTDMQWRAKRAREYSEPGKEFIVTTNGAFHRPEVLRYLEHLHHYAPTKDKVVIIPCAADKPYPSPMMKAVLAMLPDDYYLMNATGVLGLVPQYLWPAMPYYDAGIPNEWRIFTEVQRYFGRFAHDRIVVYGDFNNLAIYNALDSIRLHATFILPVQFYYDYTDLLNPVLLERLREALK